LNKIEPSAINAYMHAGNALLRPWHQHLQPVVHERNRPQPRQSSNEKSDAEHRPLETDDGTGSPARIFSSDPAANQILANYGKSFAQFYKDRNIAIQVGNNSAFNIIHNNGEGMRWDIVNLPTFSDLPNAGPNTYPYGYFLSKNSPNREIAFLAISAMLEESAQLEAARKKASVPVIRDRSFLDTFGSEVPYLQGKNAKGLVPRKYGESIPVDPYISVATSSLNTAFYEVVAGTKDINTALREAEEAANAKLSALP
jgi:hypothetical protein